MRAWAFLNAPEEDKGDFNRKFQDRFNDVMLRGNWLSLLPQEPQSTGGLTNLERGLEGVVLDPTLPGNSPK